jgi:asparagine synthase (glutamine-hydrolysing)
MCAIAGILTTDGTAVEAGALGAMAAALRHRGPDACGLRADLGVPDDRRPVSAGLAHTRLAIIDLSDQAGQPMSNEDGDVWVVFNGEIYNFQPLRAELRQKGHVFRSQSDTEVLLRGYEEYGAGILSRLNGMFAFAIWDLRDKSLFLARDRFGKKPLYYALTPRGISFASELTALLRNPALGAELDLKALGRYLLHEYVPAPHSLIRGVLKLPQAHALIWRPDTPARIYCYWRPGFGQADISLDEAAQKLRALFRRAVERRLISDVPLGVFLSGGVDSSCVTAAMRECMPADKIRSFAIGFKEKSFDESAFARESAAYFGTRHREKIFTAGAMLDILPAVWDFMDEPLADASLLPTYLLSAFAREHVTVALGGDGGDELFAGYDTFAALWPAELYSALPAPGRRLAERLARLLPASTRNMSLDFKLKQFMKGCRYDPKARVQAWMAAFCPDEQMRLLTPEAAREALAEDPFQPVRRLAEEAALSSRVEAAIHYYIHWYLSGDILTKVDRASMAVSLEARAPFLDLEVAEFVNSLPPKMKYRWGARKRLLRKAFYDVLPRGALSRPKKGFGIPLAAWLKKELRPAMEHAFAPDRLRRESLFNADFVRGLMGEHIAGKADHRKQLWTLLVFQNWRERVLGNTSSYLPEVARTNQTGH